MSSIRDSPKLFLFILFSVRGYLPAATDSRKNLMNVNVEQETLRELYTRYLHSIIVYHNDKYFIPSPHKKMNLLR